MVEGAGSVLQTQKTSKVIQEGKDLFDMRLRYFSPREIARLHGFPEDFRFPPSLSTRQQYQLLGNSLSVTVVQALLEVLFA